MAAIKQTQFLILFNDEQLSAAECDCMDSHPTQQTLESFHNPSHGKKRRLNYFNSEYPKTLMYVHF